MVRFDDADNESYNNDTNGQKEENVVFVVDAYADNDSNNNTSQTYGFFISSEIKYK